MEAAMLTEKSFDTGETVVNYAEGEPTGKPVVLLHGSTQSWQAWKWLTQEKYLSLLARGWHVYVPDLRGHGKSERTAPAYVYEDFLPDIIALIERQVREPVVLVGFSLGAAIALGVGARRPDLVRAVILLEPGLVSLRDSDFTDSYAWAREMMIWLKQTQTSARSIEELMVRCREAWPDRDESEIVRAAHSIYNLDPRFVDLAMNNQVLKDYRPEMLLPRLACPTLLVYGEARLGSVLDEADLELFKQMVPHGVTVHIADVGHGLIGGDVRQTVLTHMMQFLSSL
jgi:pimeloyl-ACP methyl ester carboxylesterase